MEAVVVHSKALEAAALPQEPSPRQVQRSTRNIYLSFTGHVGIREIDVEQDVGFFDHRTEQQRPFPINGQFETGQKTGPFVVKAFRARTKGMDVTTSIEQAECVAMLQNLNVIIGQRGGSNNAVLIITPIDVVHESLSSVSDGPAQPASEGGSEKKGRANACDADRFTKPFRDPTEQADPTDGSCHSTC